MRVSVPVFIPVVATIIFLLICAESPDSAAASSSDTFVYAGCSPQKYSTGSQYSANVNALLSSLLAASSYSTSTNLTVNGTLHGLFQCRRDIPDCPTCVSASISQLSAACLGSTAAALRLDGCYIKYDNASFFGVEDKTVVVNKCGPGQVTDPGQLDRVQSVLGYLVSDQSFRVGGDGDVQGAAECVGGLGPSQCQDCLTEAVTLLKSACTYAASGDVFLATCYARYTVSGGFVQSPPTHQRGSTTTTTTTNDGVTNDGQTQKTLAIIIGIIAVVALIVISAAWLKKHCKDDCDK